MPATLTYPGVYIEEIPSGVRTITGVATSITAFIGRALTGPVNEAVTINGYGDFERIFGGLWGSSTMGYAVRDFFLNGGGQAIIVRLFNPFFANEGARLSALVVATAQAQAAAVLVALGVRAAETGATPGTTTADDVADAADPVIAGLINPSTPALAAATAVAQAARTAANANPASTSAIDLDAVADAAETAVAGAVSTAAAAAAPINRAQINANGLNLEAANEGSWGNNLRARVDYNTRPLLPGELANSLFNLSIRNDATGQTEVHRNVSVVADHARQVDRVLLNESSLARVRGTLTGPRPTAHPDPQVGQDMWATNDPPTPATTPATNSPVSTSASNGNALGNDQFIGAGSATNKTGLYALDNADLFNLLCIPPYDSDSTVDGAVIGEAAAYCERRRAMLIVDPPSTWNTVALAIGGLAAGVGTVSKNSALFFPRLRQPNPLRENQVEDFVPCGAVAGVMARTDTTRGVWKAPAGLDATLAGVPALSVSMTDAENGQLNPLGVNCLRGMPAGGRVIWGARTLQGNDRLASEWKYIPVRRTALFIEESLYRGTQWVVFEPNDEPLWAQIRLNLGAFMHNLFRQGAFQGKTPREAYFVKCDKETTTQNDINLGIVNIIVGFAPLKPAEFVVIKLQQMAGQIET